MYHDQAIWIGNCEDGEHISIIPKMANRHGLIAGATGTGKTVTLKVMAESFSDMGVPVFMADVKGDLAGMFAPGVDSEDMQKRISRFGLADAGFSYHGYPVTLWDIYGEKGIQLRTTISEIGPLLLSRILDLNDIQSDIMTIIFKIADDNGLLLIDTKDLKAMLNFVDENRDAFAADYGKISSSSVGAIMRALVALELDGGDIFFGEPALAISDWLTLGAEGKGMMNILASDSLINSGRLYSTFLLWLLSELFETLPEVGDLDKPKMVFFFDEAHLLFEGATKTLLDKISQVVKLIRSKGVGIYFCTQSPSDIPDAVLSQLGNKVQHALRAYTPADQKKLKAAADSYRANPAFDTAEVISGLGTGQAIVSFLDASGTPGIVQKVSVLPPQSRMGTITDSERDQCIKASLLYSKYANAHDPDSAYEFLMRRGLEQEAQAAQAAQEQQSVQGTYQEAGAEPAGMQQMPGQGIPAPVLTPQQKAQIAAEEKARKEAERAAEKARKEAEAAAEKARKEAEKEAERIRREAEKIRQEAEREAEKARKEAERAAEKARKEAEKEAAARRKAAKSVGSTLFGTVGREFGKQVGKKYGKAATTLGGNLGASLGRGILNTLFRT